MKTKFSTPRRQELRGIAVIYVMTLLKRIRQNIYALVPLLSEKIRENYLEYVFLGVFILLVLQLLYSYKSYLNFKFHIKNEHLYLKHGVFKIANVEIPFDRIQNININQNLIQQMLNVVGVEIETAGKVDAEINIKALSKDDAILLKNILLEKKQSQINDEEISAEESSISKKQNEVFKLNLTNLFKVGLSSNYIKGFGIVLAFGITLFQFTSDVFKTFTGQDLEPNFDKIPDSTPYVMVFFFVFVMVLSFVVTVTSTVIRYFELKVFKLKNDFEVEYGLFKRINKVIKKEKTQVFEIVENPISTLFGIKNIYVSQASSNELTNKNKIGIVGIGDKEIHVFFKSLFELDFNQYFIKKPSDFRFFFRLIFRYLGLIIVGSIAVSFIFNSIAGTALTAIVSSAFFTLIAFKRYKKSSIELNENLIKINAGSIHTTQKYISIHKIQSAALKRNIFQQRSGFADIIIYTASGSERIDYIPIKEAYNLLNYLSYKVEISEVNWI